MGLIDVASYATIIEAVFVVISVILILKELRTNTKLTKAANSQSLVEISSPLNLQLIQDEEMAKMWVLGADNYPNRALC